MVTKNMKKIMTIVVYFSMVFTISTFVPKHVPILK